jgi:transposase
LICWGLGPVWRNENRGRYDRSRLRYPSDLTDEEWGLTEPLIPPSKRGGNRRTVNVREVVNGLMYVLSTASGGRSSSIAIPANPLVLLRKPSRATDAPGLLPEG